MKITRERMAEIARQELKKILNECADCGHMEHHGDVEDYEADMFKGHLFTMAKQAADLNEMISEQEDIEEWVQEKIAIAAQALDTVYDYLVYQKSKDGHDHYEEEYEVPLFEEEEYVAPHESDFDNEPESFPAILKKAPKREKLMKELQAKGYEVIPEAMRDQKKEETKELYPTYYKTDVSFSRTDAHNNEQVAFYTKSGNPIGVHFMPNGVVIQKLKIIPDTLFGGNRIDTYGGQSLERITPQMMQKDDRPLVDIILGIVEQNNLQESSRRRR